jgi:[ribosomal protein S5]-alanine N-acetyltransferase
MMQSTATNAAGVSVAAAFIPRMIDSALILKAHRIETQRLCLRPVNELDLDDFVELFSESSVLRFIGIKAGYIPDQEEIVQLHNGAVQAWKLRGYGRWSMFDKDTAEFVGFCGFRAESGQPELICAMHERFWGRELGLEAAVACLSHGFKYLGFTQVKAFTRPDHRRARRLLEKLKAPFLGYVDFHGVEGAAYRLLPVSVDT